MFKKVKNWLGIEGVKVSATASEPFDASNTDISGNIELTSMSEQYVEEVKVELFEKYQRGRRKSKLVDQYSLGAYIIEVGETVGPEAPISFPFNLNYKYNPSAVDRFASKNFLYRGIASAARLLKNAKSDFYIIVEATVKSNALKPYAKVELE